jgi:hypothetical protein
MLHCGCPASLTEHCGHGWTSCPARSRLRRGSHRVGPLKKGLLRPRLIDSYPDCRAVLIQIVRAIRPAPRRRSAPIVHFHTCMHSFCRLPSVSCAPRPRPSAQSAAAHLGDDRKFPTMKKKSRGGGASHEVRGDARGWIGRERRRLLAVMMRLYVMASKIGTVTNDGNQKDDLWGHQ